MLPETEAFVILFVGSEKLFALFAIPSSLLPSVAISRPSTVPDKVILPPICTFLNPDISLFESTTTAFEALTIPAVTLSIVSNSASDIFAEPITKDVPVIEPEDTIPLLNVFVPAIV